ncbi:MAG: hypothetical protein QXR85_00635, partial [Candidatus Micrarchaeaceae archaeon]
FIGRRRAFLIGAIITFVLSIPVYYFLYTAAHEKNYLYLLFVLLGVVLAIASKWQVHAVALSIVLIAGSSVAYAGIAANLAIYAIVSVAVLSAIIALRLFRNYLIYIFWALVLPLAFGATKMSNALLINVAIIGYYLLISSVLAIFISMASEGTRIHLGSKIVAFFKRNRNPIFYFAIALAILVLIIPIWPVKPAIILNTMSYASAQTNVLKQGIYSVFVNGSAYLGLIKNNMSTIRLFSGSNIALKSYVMRGADPQGKFQIIFRTNSSIEGLRLYFIPNSTFKAAPVVLNSSAFHSLLLNSTPLNVTFGKPQNVLKGFVNGSVAYNVKVYKNYSYNTTIQISPYYPHYSVGSVCNSSINSSVSLSIASNRSVSFFVFRNILNFSSALNSSAINAEQNYSFFIGRFQKFSYYSAINTNSTSFNSTINSCIVYVIASSTPASINLHMRQDYAVYYQKTKIAKIPALFANGGKTQAYGFLTNSIYYLSQLYANETGS